MKAIESCGISGDTNFELLWKLPKLPLTERFGRFKKDDPLAYDQELVISRGSGHVQLRYQLPPNILYTDAEYSFRTSLSNSARSGALFFSNFVRGLSGGKHFSSLVDVGGNDMFLAREFSDIAKNRAVVDPICAEQDGQTIDGIRVFGRMGEDVDLSRDVPRPDILICRHTLEHVVNPRGMIRKWFAECSDDCLYFAEIPCFENLVESMRFDAVFHQHLHYYDLLTFKRLINECGGEYIAHAYNHQVSCGGAMLIAFKKSVSHIAPAPFDIDQRISYFKRRIELYTQQMQVMRELMLNLPNPVYGFGAGLMLPTLAYHLGTDFSWLECVLDDDPEKDGIEYENLPVRVRHTQKAAPPADSSYIITSLESVRPISRRLLELSPRRVLSPLIT